MNGQWKLGAFYHWQVTAFPAHFSDPDAICSIFKRASDDRLSTPDILLDSPSQLITSTEFKDRHIVAGVWRTGLESNFFFVC